MIYCGTKDGESFGFYLESDGFIGNYFELTEKEHMKLINGQSKGKVIVFHKDKKPTLEEFNPTEKEKAQQEISELELYLKKTDWYAIRFADTGEEIPKEIKQKRQDARDRISELRNILS